MWIASKLGFFSIVQKEGGWHVRGRLRDDLDRLNQAAFRGKREVQEWPTADYRWRIVLMKPDDLGRVFETLARSVDYTNFKSQIGSLPHQREKLGAYHDLWSSLYRIQERSEN